MVNLVSRFVVAALDPTLGRVGSVLNGGPGKSRVGDDDDLDLGWSQ